MNGERKVHWIAWDKMCESKRNGGLGFRDMEAFNQALLAKQAWRLLTVPDSLCARVLKARYYKNSDVMASTCPKRGSFTWKSICHGKELLRHGVIWRIGNGEKVNIWSDNWIPRAGSMKPVGCKDPQNVRVVADLLNDPGSGWNVDKLNYIFLDSDTCDIKQIRVGGEQQEDYIAWNFTRSGVFSVRSAYHLQMSLRKNMADVAEGSSSVATHRGWLELWNTDIPGKVKIHNWRMIRNGLAVGEELSYRRIKAGVFCTACGRDESVLHRFWRCPHSAYIWKRLGETQGLCAPAPPVFVQSPHEMKNWFLDWLGQASES